MSSRRSSKSCRPRWATQRNTDRETLGHEVAWVAKKLGQDLMPWQRQVADVALELLPGTKIPAYREVGVTVPRQSGKTTLVLALEVHRALRWGGIQRIAYTAQTGMDARRKILDDQVPLLETSALWPAVKDVFRATGREGVIFKTGSRIDVLASKISSGHGRTVDLGVIDEAFDDVDDRREQALIPAMSTRAAAQLFVISTAGHSGSAYLKRKVDSGRAAVSDGLGEGTAYFEWSADEDADIDDPTTWYGCMPALGHTITESVILHARQSMTEGEFRRAFLNQWTVSEERVIPAGLWNDACSDTVAPDGRLVLGLDVNQERSAAAISVADPEARIELIQFAPGVGWVVKKATKIAKEHSAPVVIDTYGPAASLTSELEAAGVEVIGYSTREVAQACGSFYDGIADGRISLRRHPDLDLAAAAARRRTVGDTWVWGRSATGEDISPLISATLAHAGAQSHTPDADVWVSY